MVNEKRLIDANALISNLLTFKGLVAIVAETLVRFIEKQPTVDAVVLPCNIGDTVWFTTYGKPTCTTVCGVQIHIGIDGHHSYFDVIDFSGNTDGFHGEAFGKTVFLTREEAEAALAKMDGDNNE